MDTGGNKFLRYVSADLEYDFLRRILRPSYQP
jgi:hypothetical protein